MKKTILATVAVLAMGGTALAGSDVDIDQIGFANVASSLQVGSNGNKARILQQGDLNSSITKQDGSNNYLRVRQTTNLNEVGNDADNTALSQKGKDNKAYVDQYGGDSNVVYKATQDGNTNTLKVDQDGTENLVKTVLQDGNTNKANIQQTGVQNEVRNAAQIGNNNKLNIVQADYKNLVEKAESKGNSNAIKIDQDGWFNGQGNSFNGTIVGMNTSEANFGLHGGTRYASRVMQNGSSNTANIDQNGFGQAFEIYQGFGGNTSTGSKVNLTQNNAVNYAYAQQTGSAHVANIAQSGALNRTFVKQDN